MIATGQAGLESENVSCFKKSGRGVTFGLMGASVPGQAVPLDQDNAEPERREQRRRVDADADPRADLPQRRQRRAILAALADDADRRNRRESMPAL